MSKLERSTFVHAVGKYIRNIFKLLSYTNVKKQSFKKKNPTSNRCVFENTYASVWWQSTSGTQRKYFGQTDRPKTMPSSLRLQGHENWHVMESRPVQNNYPVSLA